MSKQRLISSDLWTDPWVRSVNPLDRLLIVYLISNSHANISGVYEISDDVMAFEVGLNLRDIYDAFMPRLAPKVYYHEGWVVIPKFPKHQNLKSPDVIKGIMREFENAPEKIRKYAISVGWGDGLGIVPPPSPTLLNLTKPTDVVANAPKFTDVPIGKGVEERAAKLPKDEQASGLVTWAEKRRGFPFTSKPAQLGAIGRAKRADISPALLS